MMRILFVTQTPEFGGAEKHLIDLVRRIGDSAHCTIVCFSGDFYSAALHAQPHVQVVKVPRITKRKLWSFWRVFRRYPADVIVLVKGIFEHYPLSAYVAARACGARRVMALEHLIPDPLPGPSPGGGVAGFLRRLIGWRTRYLVGTALQGYLCHVTVCVSEAIRRRLIDEYGYPTSRTITIRNGIDLSHYGSVRLRERIGSGSPNEGGPACVTLVCAARLSSVKRIDMLLDALAGTVKRYGGWRCLILGAGPLESELRERAQRLGLSAWVTFVGQVADVRPYLREADLFVLSSEKEGLPLALLEAMAAGVPAVVTDVGGTREVVVHGQNGLLVRSGSVEELERAINHMLANPEERRRMGEAARAHVQQHFDINISMERLTRTVLTRCA